MWQSVMKIEGRDRRILDEMYLHSFEMYTEQTFYLIIMSAKGQGKTVRSRRFMKIMPPGWCTQNGGENGVAGMHGNNSPENGTQQFLDEMPSHLTPAECTQRMEFVKTLADMPRRFERSKSLPVKNDEGVEKHVTYKIITEHR